ncbi:unnamed protein product [Aphis gossypii]|uniref:Uncharacterized protein n=1 Tax=Aphis gossypii TaxID=80765 RepID=A0A9P0JJU3_APHGO|nr:unnamed protein product [Aphis gossypii]
MVKSYLSFNQAPKRDNILKLIREIFGNVYHDVVAVCKVSSSWRRRTKFFSVIEFRREEFYSSARANVLRQTDPSPPKRGSGATLLLTILDEYLWRCDDIVFPGSVSRDDDAIFIRPRSIRRAHSQRRRSRSHRRHTHSVGLARTLTRGARAPARRYAHSHTTNNTIIIIIIAKPGENSGSDTTHDSRPTSTAVVCADATGARRVRVWCV